ncbi:hypothetical protein J7I93_08960 [Bacillus sp. ISL-47]|uniref:hypothetical protein n=1 Tax=Bacillus sp. ISL-47 TaxID=2819130 RepID=UPI001BE7B125|nr:hypothetical protein [Bacillus sp. ISL-47]MBT2688309.1 hypothetical protein [Bacillus sp. ISL-47]MBT2710102.1 hypothetical protein [Pseudomonas sp. ISL-84]
MEESKQNLKVLQVMIKEMEYALSEKAMASSDDKAQRIFHQGMVTASDINGFLSKRIRELNRSFHY